MVSIKGLSRASVLAALFNASKPVGMGFMVAKPGDMTEARAQSILDSGTTYFDYLEGRVMKVSMDSDDEFGERLYDRDNGDGAAQSAVYGITPMK
jgi:hypothetical protein